MKDLTLNLIGKWFKMILSRKKRVEYRAITPLYCSKFLLWENQYKTPKWWFDYYFESLTNEPIFEDLFMDLLMKKITYKKFSSVKFNNGMRKVMPRMRLEFKGITIGEGEKEFGAVPNTFYFCISLGEILEKKNINLLK